jgi:hypothetical protein
MYLPMIEIFDKSNYLYNINICNFRGKGKREGEGTNTILPDILPKKSNFLSSHKL